MRIRIHCCSAGAHEPCSVSTLSTRHVWRTSKLRLDQKKKKTYSRIAYLSIHLCMAAPKAQRHRRQCVHKRCETLTRNWTPGDRWTQQVTRKKRSLRSTSEAANERRRKKKRRKNFCSLLRFLPSRQLFSQCVMAGVCIRCGVKIEK